MKEILTNSLAQYYYQANNGGDDSASNVNLVQLKSLREAVEYAQMLAKQNGKNMSPNAKVLKLYKAALPLALPTPVFGAMVGHVLGDCSIDYISKSDQASLKFEYGNKEYAYYVYNVLANYVLSPPRVQTRVNANGNEVTTYCFQTITHPCFAVFHHLFIVNGVKTVPAGLVTHFVTPQALATWYMDDGGLGDYRGNHGNTIYINTHCFEVEVVQQMVDELNYKYDLNSRVRIINRKHGQPVIVIPSRSYPKFYSIVHQYIDESMMYKLPMFK